jgi:hypothetical protein
MTDPLGSGMPRSAGGRQVGPASGSRSETTTWSVELTCDLLYFPQAGPPDVTPRVSLRFQGSRPPTRLSSRTWSGCPWAGLSGNLADLQRVQAGAGHVRAQTSAGVRQPSLRPPLPSAVRPASLKRVSSAPWTSSASAGPERASALSIRGYPQPKNRHSVRLLRRRTWTVLAEGWNWPRAGWVALTGAQAGRCAVVGRWPVSQVQECRSSSAPARS